MNTWIYGKDRDFQVFGLPLLVAISLGILFPGIEFVHTMLVYVVVDISHSFSTYFYTMNSDRLMTTRHRYYFLSVPIVIYSLACLLRVFEFTALVLSVYTLWSLFHFMKQSQAWVIIAAKKNGPQTQLEKFSDSLISYVVVWCPQIISMAVDYEPTCWFIPGDIPNLPTSFKEISYGIASLSFIIYFFVEIRRWRRQRVVQWSKHFHVLNALTIWIIARMNVFHSMSQSVGPLIMMAGHSAPYFFLGHRYLKERVQQGERFWPNFKSHNVLIFSIWISCLILTALQFWRLQYPRSLWVSSIPLTIALTHYAFDSYLWKKKFHPEGANVLSR